MAGVYALSGHHVKHNMSMLYFGLCSAPKLAYSCSKDPLDLYFWILSMDRCLKLRHNHETVPQRQKRHLPQSQEINDYEEP